MTQRVKSAMTLTRGLWLANGLLWLLPCGFLAFGAAKIFLGGEAPPLRLDPLRTEAMPPLALASAGTRNPFDPAGAAWLAADSPGPAATPGQVRGIVVLPGVAVALTDRGAVKPGAALDAGRLRSVKTTGAVVDTPGGPQALVLPGSNRPSLQDLNRARPAAPSVAASIQGKS